MEKLLQRFSSNDLFVVFSNSRFLAFCISVILSQFAFNTMNIVLVFLMYLITGSSTSVALLIFTFMIPQIFLSFVGGVVADIQDKKKILIVGNLLRAIFVFLLYFGYTEPIVIYLLAFCIAVATHFYVPSEAPYIPHLVPKKYLLSANAIFSMSFFSSILVGYVGAGPSIEVFGRNGVFVFIGVIFILATIFASMLPSTKQEIDSEKKSSLSLGSFIALIRRELRGSIRELLGANPIVRNAFLLLAFSQVVIFVLATIIPEYAETILSIPTEKISLLLFAPAAAGMISSSLIVGGVLHGRNKTKMMNIGIFVSGLVLILFPAVEYASFISHLFLAGALAFCAGIANAFIFVPSQTLIQENVPESHRSKIFGLLYVVIGILSFIPIIIAGIFTDTFGVDISLLAIGMIIIGLGIGRVSLNPATVLKIAYNTLSGKKI